MNALRIDRVSQVTWRDAWWVNGKTYSDEQVKEALAEAGFNYTLDQMKRLTTPKYREASKVDLREVAREVIPHMGQVAWWRGALWIDGRVYEDKEARLLVASAMERVGVTHVAHRHVTTSLMHVKSLAATSNVPERLRHLADCFCYAPGSCLSGREVRQHYQEYCEREGIEFDISLSPALSQVVGAYHDDYGGWLHVNFRPLLARLPIHEQSAEICTRGLG